MYPFTWKHEMGVELHKIRQHLDKASRSCLEQDFKDASAWLERFLMISAFTIRRLSESRHLKIDLDKRFLKALSYSKRKGASKIDLSNWQDVTTYYQTDIPKVVTIPARHICNQLMHSFILLDCGYEDETKILSGFIVTSDIAREKVVLYIEHENYFIFIEEVVIDGTDGYVYNRDTGFVEKN